MCNTTVIYRTQKKSPGAGGFTTSEDGGKRDSQWIKIRAENLKQKLITMSD